MCTVSTLNSYILSSSCRYCMSVMAVVLFCSLCKKCDVGCCFFFFFQAEDGIRDYKVTGVQTCALPISLPATIESRRTRWHQEPGGAWESMPLLFSFPRDRRLRFRTPSTLPRSARIRTIDRKSVV